MSALVTQISSHQIVAPGTVIEGLNSGCGSKWRRFWGLYFQKQASTLCLKKRPNFETV